VPNLTLKERAGVWHASGTIGGQRVRQSLGTRDRARAEELCALLEARLWKRRSYGEEAVRTFEEAVASYVTQGGERRFLAPLLLHFKGRNVAGIKPGDVREAALALYPNASPATRNRQAIIPARAVINHAQSMGWCPRISVELFEVRKRRKAKPASRSWLERFMAQADADGLPHLSALVLFMHQTGARRSEAVRLMGEHVDLERRVALLERTKTEEWSARHLTAELVVRLAALEPCEGEPVFRYTEPAAVNRRMTAVCDRAGIERKGTHAAGRHSFGTNAMNAGAHVKAAMEAGGWKSARLFLETYVHADGAGRDLAAIFDAQTGPVGTDLARSGRRKGYRFGRKG
jgi:integrase